MLTCRELSSYCSPYTNAKARPQYGFPTPIQHSSFASQLRRKKERISGKKETARARVAAVQSSRSSWTARRRRDYQFSMFYVYALTLHSFSIFLLVRVPRLPAFTRPDVDLKDRSDLGGWKEAFTLRLVRYLSNSPVTLTIFFHARY